MVFKTSLGAALLAAGAIFTANCGVSSDPFKPRQSTPPKMSWEMYDMLDGSGKSVKTAHDDSDKHCDLRSPNLGSPDGTPNEDHICAVAPRDLAEAVTNPTCPCTVNCLRPYFDHNKNRSPEGTMQMYTPPASRRYYPGVPSAKHWENGVTQNIFTYDVQLTNFYDVLQKNVVIVLVAVSPDEGRQGFEDSRPNQCLNNQYAIWSFGDIAAGQTLTRTVKMWLPNDEPFKITGFILSLDGAECTATLNDTDGDGLTNAEEIALGTDPNDPDTDGDGLFDKAEDLSGTFVNWWETGTDPLKRDTDGDCFGDGTEVAENTSPLNAGSHPDRKCSQADLTNPKP